MPAISRSVRERVIRRAQGLCEYCQTSQRIVVEMEVDHIIPESAGGSSDENNLCLACVSCNHFKGRAQTALDPDSKQSFPLFNPRLQRWSEHFQWDEEQTHILGLTGTGRATVICLNMNRDLVVQARERWVRAGWHPSRLPD